MGPATRTYNGNGSVEWRMPKWFEQLLVWSGTTLTIGLCSLVGLNTQARLMGNRFTAEDGRKHEQRIDVLEKNYAVMHTDLSYIKVDVGEIKTLAKKIERKLD